ncbi:MAG TPA: hypothetical protein VGS07_09135 [Thermoanaerobaculia bacterium]|jgi:ELWxxDGT repeat protein|nr:hypothetical protein [Thermoanaerobaculia bacterium]
MERPRIVVQLVLTLFAATVLPVSGETLSSSSSNPFGFTKVGNRVVFFAHDLTSFGALWSTDGTPAGTLRLTDEADPAARVGVVGSSYLWFVQAQSGYSLWRTAGTPATTFPLVADGIFAPNPDDFPFPWAIVGGKLQFFRYSAANVLELWTSNGTTAGTHRSVSLPKIKDVPLVAASSQGWLFFFTATPHPQFGITTYDHWAVWRTGGTAASTRRLASLPDYVFSAHPSTRRLLFLSGGQLWASDGSVAGTAPFFGPPANPPLEVHVFLGTAGDKLYMLAHTGSQSESLWVFDGTRRGTGIVSPALSLDSPAAATVGDRIFFVASDGVHGSELWSSRGTARTTMMVADLCPGSCSAFPQPNAIFLVTAGGRVFFQAEDPTAGRELFVSNGTAAGTRLVLDLCPGACGSSAGLLPAGGEVYFYGRDPEHGVELWASDGTPGGTRRLSDFTLADLFGTGDAGALPAPSLAILGNRVVTLGFDPASGFEPWVFNRAGGGGQRLADIF